MSERIMHLHIYTHTERGRFVMNAIVYARAFTLAKRYTDTNVVAVVVSHNVCPQTNSTQRRTQRNAAMSSFGAIKII